MATQMLQPDPRRDENAEILFGAILFVFFFLLTVSWGSLSVPQSIQCLMLLSDQIEEAPPALHLLVLTFYHGSESNL